MQRSRSYARRGTQIKPKHKSKKAIINIVLGICLCLSIVYYISYHSSHKYGDSPNIKLGTSGYCLDDYQNKLSDSALVNAWPCNATRAEIWTVSGINLVHDNYCLGVANNATAENSKVVLSPCDGSSGQVWLRDKGGYQNPNSTLCLSTSLSNPSQSLFISQCSNLDRSIETWSPVASANSNKILVTSCSGDRSALVACYAEQQWTTWQSGTVNHNSLLNTYTDGTPYEEWCADFVSYIYKEAGYPFTQGSADGWDENNANDIQYMGFTVHNASSGYLPKPGDVAFFNYSAGHVEIVISGGKQPTFIYGDSATIDPTTGNGQMKANTILGNVTGQIVYYLSPN